MSQLLEFISNHPLLVAGTVAMLVAALLFEIRTRARALFELSPADAVKLINQGATVVDLRPAERYQAGHIVDALNLDAAALARPDEKKLKKKKPVLVVCDTGGESVKAAASLRSAGWDMSFALKGGLGTWERENLPLVAAKR